MTGIFTIVVEMTITSVFMKLNVAVQSHSKVRINRINFKNSVKC